MKAEQVWMHRMEEQTAKHLQLLRDMSGAIEDIRVWIGGD